MFSQACTLQAVATLVSRILLLAALIVAVATSLCRVGVSSKKVRPLGIFGIVGPWQIWYTVLTLRFWSLAIFR